MFKCDRMGAGLILERSIIVSKYDKYIEDVMNKTFAFIRDFISFTFS